MFEIKINVIEEVATEIATLLNVGQNNKPGQRYEISANNLTSLNDVKLLSAIAEYLEKEVKSSMSELKIPSKFAFDADSRVSLKEILFMEDIFNRALQLQLWAAEQAALICIGNPDSLWSIQLEILDWIRTHSDFLTNSKSAIPNN